MNDPIEYSITQLRMLVSGSDTGMLLTDKEGTCLTINQYAADDIGISIEEAIGRHIEVIEGYSCIEVDTPGKILHLLTRRNVDDNPIR